MLSLFAESPEPDEEYWKMPVKASVSFGLGPALKLAPDAGESAGAYMGTIMTRGAKGQVIDELSYMKYIREAYDIAGSITLE